MNELTFFFLFEKLYRKFAADTGWRETVLAVTATTPKSELVQFLAFLLLLFWHVLVHGQAARPRPSTRESGPL